MGERWEGEWEEEKGRGEGGCYIIINPRHACAGGLWYLCMCVSVPTLASTLFVSTFQVRYIRLSFRLFSIFNSWIFDKTFQSNVMV